MANKKKKKIGGVSQTETSKGSKLHKTAGKAKQITHAIAMMIAVGLFSYSLVEEPTFKNILSITEPDYNIPSRTTFSRTIVPGIYLKEKARIQKEILDDLSQGITCLAFTTDGWTSRAIESYISLTLHYVSSKLISRHIVLNIRYLRKSHTGENLYHFLKEIMIEWNLFSTVKHIFYVTDNGPNIVKAVKLGKEQAGWKRIPCFAHTLQLAVRDATKACKGFPKLVKRCSKIVGYFSRYSVARAKLMRIQVLMNSNSTPLSLIQNIDTRWNSEYFMFERLLKLMKPLNKLLKQKGMPKGLSFLQWKVVEKYVEVLEPLKDATEIMSGDEYPTSSSYIPMVHGIINSVQDSLEKGKKTILSVNLLKAVKRRFAFIKKNSTLKMSTVIDPRYKDRYFNTKTKRNLSQKLYGIASSTSIASDETERASELSHRRTLSGEPRSKIRKFFDVQLRNDQRTPKIKDEIKFYLEESVQPFDVNPLSWWQEHRNRYPRLGVVAMSFLGIPATQASSERLFSTAGNVATAKRASVAPEHVEEICFLHHNMQIPSQEAYE